MENIKRHDLVLTGNGSAAGGVFNKVKITGEETVNGDLECIDLKLVGTCHMDGNVKLESGRITGTSEIRGNLEAGRLRMVGTINIDGNVSVKELKVHGEVKVRGDISAEKWDVLGLLDVKGNCNTDEFISKSPFNIGGLLNAGKIDVQLHSKCYAGEIGGENINIRRGKDMIIKKIIKSLYLPHDFYDGQLVTETIEGDNVYAEYTHAKVVRGNNVKIGPGCEIGWVEYKGSFEQAEDSNIKESRKI